jgi:competence ComEA-like helix-hairpin-helix protein
MRKWCSPLLLWFLSAGLWVAVAVERGAAGNVSGMVVKKSSSAPQGATRETESGAFQTGDSCININRADAKQLGVLPGVGPVIAQLIVDFREANGPFTKLSDLERVKGIGPVTTKKIGALACF